MKNLIEQIKELGYGYDYHPMEGGIIYKAQEYFESKREGKEVKGMRVVSIIDGSNCGFIHESNPIEVDWEYFNR